jgi:hypothetical protein
LLQVIIRGALLSHRLAAALHHQQQEWTSQTVAVVSHQELEVHPSAVALLRAV